MTKKATILATAPLDAYARSAFSAFGDIVVAPDMQESTLVGLMDDVVALVVRGAAPITEAVISRGNALKVIGRTGVGYDTVDIAAATRHGIPVIYTPGAGSRAVAEAALAFMLALAKRIPFWDQQLKSGNWKSRYEAQGSDLDGKTLGIVGLGRIGQILAMMARPFEMCVIAYDPFLDGEVAAGLGVRLVELDELVRQADFISIHCPQTPETTGLIDRRRLDLVKPGSYLINLSRGGLIESLDVLADALDDGKLAGVALDVFDPAPPDVSHRLFAIENCLTSPHSMATTMGAMTRIFKSMTDDMTAVLTGNSPRYVVNREAIASDRHDGGAP